MIVAGMGIPGGDGAMLVIGLSKKDRQELEAGNPPLFYANIGGSIALMASAKEKTMLVIKAETDNDVMAEMKKWFAEAGLHDPDFHVIYNHGRHGEE